MIHFKAARYRAKEITIVENLSAFKDLHSGTGQGLSEMVPAREIKATQKIGMVTRKLNKCSPWK